MFVNWKFKIMIIPNSLAKRLSHDVRLEDEISVEILNSVCLISFESIDLRHFRSLSSDLSGFIAPPIPLASPYLVPYSEHTTVLTCVIFFCNLVYKLKITISNSNEIFCHMLS